MRISPRIAAISALATLSACAEGGGQYTPAVSHGPPLSAADRADPVGAIRRAGAGDAMTAEGAKTLFGPADVERHDGAGAILTWRTATCAIVLVFGGPDLRLGAADVGAKDQHAAAPPLDLCVREALARRNVS